jgi:hypothetical protein
MTDGKLIWAPMSAQSARVSIKREGGLCRCLHHSGTNASLKLVAGGTREAHASLNGTSKRIMPTIDRTLILIALSEVSRKMTQPRVTLKCCFDLKRQWLNVAGLRCNQVYDMRTDCLLAMSQWLLNLRAHFNHNVNTIVMLFL